MERRMTKASTHITPMPLSGQEEKTQAEEEQADEEENQITILMTTRQSLYYKNVTEDRDEDFKIISSLDYLKDFENQ